MTDKVTAAIERLGDITLDYVVYADCGCSKCEKHRANAATLRAVIEILEELGDHVIGHHVAEYFAERMITLLPEVEW